MLEVERFEEECPKGRVKEEVTTFFKLLFLVIRPIFYWNLTEHVYRVRRSFGCFSQCPFLYFYWEFFKILHTDGLPLFPDGISLLETYSRFMKNIKIR